MWRLIVSLVMSAWCLSASVGAKDFYVSPQGHPHSDGSRQRPFGSLEQARDAVRLYRAQAGDGFMGAAQVCLLAGDYYRTSSFELSAADGGMTAAPTIYYAEPNTEVRIIGGARLDPSAFVPLNETHDLWDAVIVGARSHVMVCSLPQQGITAYGKLRSRGFGRNERAPLELCIAGQMQQLARWPNEGFVTIAEAVNDTTFHYRRNRCDRWLQAEDPWAFGYWKYGWADRYESITSIDPSRQEITLADKPGYGIAKDRLWYALNLIEELDAPGEYYLHRSTGDLYVWPSVSLQADSEMMVSLVGENREPLLHIHDCASIEFQNMEFSFCRYHAVQVRNAQHIRFRGCMIQNTGAAGMSFSNCQYSGIESSTLTGLGGTGVALSGGDRSKLKGGLLVVYNNHIYNYGRWQRTYAPAVRISGVGHLVSHNVIHDAPHAAILYGGNGHRIVFNDISRVCYDSDDAAALYTGRDWGSRGNLIQHNFIHDLDVQADHPTHHGVHGVYLDDCDSGDIIHGNVFYRVSGAAVFIGGGRDNIVTNNVMAKCGWAIHSDRRGVTWKGKVNNRPGDSWNLLEKIERYNYTQPPWSRAYPELAAIFDEDKVLPGFDLQNPTTYPHAREPKGCVLVHNIGWQNKLWQHGSGYEHYRIEHNIQDEDPRFINEENLNLSLHTDSPVWTLPDFEPIPFENIGLKSQEK